MADIPSPGSYVKLNDIEIANEQPVTTSLFTKFGGNVNKLIDDVSISYANINYLSSTTYSWLYDAASNRTYIPLFSITKTRGTFSAFSIPVLSTLGTTSTTSSQAGFFMSFAGLAGVTAQLAVSFYRSQDGVTTPLSSTNVTPLFSLHNYFSGSGTPPPVEGYPDLIYRLSSYEYNIGSHSSSSHVAYRVFFGTAPGVRGARAEVLTVFGNMPFNVKSTDTHKFVVDSSLVSSSGTYTYGIYVSRINTQADGTGDYTGDSRLPATITYNQNAGPNRGFVMEM